MRSNSQSKSLNQIGRQDLNACLSTLDVALQLVKDKDENAFASVLLKEAKRKLDQLVSNPSSEKEQIEALRQTAELISTILCSVFDYCDQVEAGNPEQSGEPSAVEKRCPEMNPANDAQVEPIKTTEKPRRRLRPINVEMLRIEAGDELAHDVLSMYAQNIDELMVELKHRIEARDKRSTLDALSEVMTAGTTLGAIRIVELVLELEKVVRGEDWNQVTERFSALESEAYAIADYVRKLLRQTQAQCFRK